MSDVGALFHGLGLPLSFTPHQLEKLSPDLVQSLQLQGVLEEVQPRSWFCDACCDDHEYIFWEEKVLQHCPEDDTTPPKEIAHEAMVTWQINWQHLVSRICEANKLSPWLDKPMVKDSLPIGSGHWDGQNTLFFLSGASTIDGLLAQVNHATLSYPDYSKVLVMLSCFPIDASASSILTTHNTQVVDFEQLAIEQWHVPPLTDELQESPKLILNTTRRTLQIEGGSVELTAYLFDVALILARANGNPVTSTEVSDQYYQMRTESNATGGVDLKAYCSRINKAVRESTKAEERVFVSHGKGSYKLNSVYTPIKILS